MLFKKEIRVTRDFNELNRIRESLAKNGIATSVITNTPTNPGRYHGMPFIKSSAAYQYHIYVAKKDVEKAKQILYSF